MFDFSWKINYSEDMGKGIKKFLEILGIIFILISFTAYSFLLFSPQSNGEIAGKTITKEIKNTISIGDFLFNLFGYTSPNAQVTFQGMGIYDQTYANERGYFQFKNRFSPFSPREACLTAKDQLGRLTSAVCLPPFPTFYNVTIGPVIMPPTLSLDKNDYFVGDEVILSGQTIPNTEVNLSIFTKEKDLRRLIADFGRLIKPVEAFSFPQLTTTADSKGNFAIALPSSSSQNFRLFVQSQYQKQLSPKSIQLNFKILPVWMIIIKFFWFLWLIIKSRLLEIIILAEIVALSIFFLRRYLHPHSIIKERAIILRDKFSLMKLKNKI